MEREKLSPGVTTSPGLNVDLEKIVAPVALYMVTLMFIVTLTWRWLEYATLRVTVDPLTTTVGVRSRVNAELPLAL